MTSRKGLLYMLFIALIGLVSAPAVDDTFTAVNPSTGQTEAVWVGTPKGATSSEIFSAVQEGTDWSPSGRITNNATNDKEPHLAFTPTGDRKVVWWNDDDVDSVFLSTKAAAGGAWSTPVLVSDGIEDARAPSVAVFSGTTYVVYEAVPPSGNRKVICGSSSDPNPWGRVLIAVSSQPGPLSVAIHNESGRLWVTWRDSATLMGYSRFIGGVWTPALTEPYSGEQDVEPARSRIRTIALGS